MLSKTKQRCIAMIAVVKVVLNLLKESCHNATCPYQDDASNNCSKFVQQNDSFSLILTEFLPSFYALYIRTRLTRNTLGIIMYVQISFTHGMSNLLRF